MSKTLVVSDAFFAELTQLVAAAGGGTPQQPPSGGTTTPTPPSTTPTNVPAGVRVIKLPWAHTPQPIPNVTIAPGETIAFAITPPPGSNSGGALGNFSISPTNADAYLDRVIALARAPGEFSNALGPSAIKTGQEPNVYFSVGGYPLDRYGRPNTENPNLLAGTTYYVNVKHVDPSATGTINYGLAPS